MKKAFISLFAGMLIFGFASGAKAAVLTFDEFDLNNWWGDFNTYYSNNYPGFTFSNAYIVDKDYLHGSGYEYGVISPENALYGGYGSAPNFTIAKNEDFIFNGAYFTSSVAQGNTVTLTAYNDGKLIKKEIFSNSINPEFINFEYLGPIDQVTINTDYKYCVIDNFKYTPAPEPSSMVLGLMGLGSMLGLRKRNKKVEA